ncbi:unnamed protein product [Caenorhabditis nigoni]
MKKFPILKVPDVIFREVTSMMTPIEIIKLVMSDFKMERWLQQQKYKILGVNFRLGNARPQIDIETSNRVTPVAFEKSKNIKMKPATDLVQLKNRYRIRKCCNDNMDITYVSLDELFCIYSSLSRIFPCQIQNWILQLDELKLDEFWDYIRCILALEFHHFTVCSVSMTNDFLTKLLNEIPENASFIIDSDIRRDYSNSKALRFRSVEYKEARWMKLENLFSIRNSHIIKLKTTTFKCSDVNQFLNYWSDCGEDMMETICITLKEGEQINKQEILKNLLAIYNKKKSEFMGLIKARKMGNRKLTVGSLEINGNVVIFSAFNPFNGDFLDKYSILELLQQKRDCEEKIREIANGFSQVFRDWKKKKLQLELEELEGKLAVANFYCRWLKRPN